MKKSLLVLSAVLLSAPLMWALTEEDALKKAMPSADYFNAKEADGIDYFEAVKDKEVTGYCVRVTADGYSGPIKMIVGVDLNGVIQDVEVLEHKETPGFGAKVAEDDFLSRFRGKDAASKSMSNSVDAVTGATASSKTVIDAIDKTVGEFVSKVRALKSSI